MVLNTFESKKAVIVDKHGKAETDFNFEFGEKTSVTSASCSMAYKNQFLVFGGTGDNKRQISKLSGCRLETIGNLDFDHRHGACTGVRDTKIYLCFSSTFYSHADFKKCRYAENPLDTFSEAASSTYKHIMTNIAASDCKSTISHSKF